jgi:Uma2 family endonuclease
MMADLMTATPRIPKLQPGDRLTRDEFERRYNAMPELKKAELIEGVVYMASAVRCRDHGQPEHLLSNWLGDYEFLTPGLIAAHNSTVRLDLDNEPQPDLVLWLPETVGGRARCDADGYLEGAPELVIEVAASSVSYDLHQKLGAYRRNGVRECLVHRVEDTEVDWFLLDGGEYVRQEPDAVGVLKSRMFPGLWLNPEALLRQDLVTLRRVVERGCATPEHGEFVRRLAAAL